MNKIVSIKKTLQKDLSLTILTVNGKITSEDLIQFCEDLCNHGMTRHLLWDLTNADLTRITKGEIEQIAKVGKSYADLRINGKTAFLAHQDLQFGLSRMYQAATEIKEHPIQHCVFRDMEKAIAWLKSK
jgi:hypothetical protein